MSNEEYKNIDGKYTSELQDKENLLYEEKALFQETTAIVTPKTNPVKENKLIRWSVAVFLINLAAMANAYLTSSYDVASSMGSVTAIGGILGSVLLGAGMVQVTLATVDNHSGGLTGLMKLGLILIIFGIITGPLTLIPGIIFLMMGLYKPAQYPQASGKQFSPIGRAFLAIAAFIGGGIAGLAISSIIYFATYSRACELSSSKCM